MPSGWWGLRGKGSRALPPQDVAWGPRPHGVQAEGPSPHGASLQSPPTRSRLAVVLLPRPAPRAETLRHLSRALAHS